MKNTFLKSVNLIFILLFIIGCTDDLDTKPKGVVKTLDELLAEQPTFAGLVSKVYGSLALSGPDGPASSDVPGDDAGTSPFLRAIINLQDFTADGMKNRWGDDGLDQLTTTKDWTNNNKFFRYMYNRIYYTATQSNDLILKINGLTIPKKDQIIGELRFLRALSYFYLIDCFGKGPLLTEKDFPGALKPESTRTELFNFVESELLSIEPILPNRIGYGQANKQVVRVLLSKLYLNSAIYTGTARYNDALLYSKKVIDEGGYSLAPSYTSLFSADNNVTSAKNEIIYALIADANISQSFGNTTYIVNGSLNESTMPPSQFGALEAWGGHRATKAWYGLYGSNTAAVESNPDLRSKLFWTNSASTDVSKRHNYEMNDYKEWIDGFPSTKFRNTNFVGSSITTKFSSTDFPLFRLADIYLIYAECVVRGGGGNISTALQYVNEIRTRSGAAVITASQLNEGFILDERARELNLEGQRRTDLIRFGKFAGDVYLWPWKGGNKNGTSISSNYNLFPIPLKALQVNTKLTQNPGF